LRSSCVFFLWTVAIVVIASCHGGVVVRIPAIATARRCDRRCGLQKTSYRARSLGRPATSAQIPVRRHGRSARLRHGPGPPLANGSSPPRRPRPTLRNPGSALERRQTNSATFGFGAPPTRPQPDGPASASIRALRPRRKPFIEQHRDHSTRIFSTEYKPQPWQPPTPWSSPAICTRR